MAKRIVPPLTVVFVMLLFSTTMAGFAIGPNLFLSLPQDDFANVSQNGGGVGVKFLFSPPLMPGFAVRADMGFAVYGSETEREEVRGIVVDVETRNQSIQFTVGPQVQTPMDPMRFYAAAMAGVYNYSTRVEIAETDIGKTESSNTKFGWNINGGMLVRVFQNPVQKFKVDIDLGAKYHTIKKAIERELRTETGTVVRKTDANDISLHLGVLFNF